MLNFMKRMNKRGTRSTHNTNDRKQIQNRRPEQQTSITLDADNDDDGDDDNDNDSHILTLPLRRRRRRRSHPPHNDTKCLRHTQNIMLYCCMYTHILLLDTLARTNVCWPRFFA